MNSLILSCGGSPEPLKFCIHDYEPDFIYFLCSPTSVDIAESIVKECKINDDQFNIKIVQNPESLEDSFSKSREVIQELQHTCGLYWRYKTNGFRIGSSSNW